MKRHLILLSFLFVILHDVGAIQLSERAEIKVMTIGPTQSELYSAFGHCAFIVVDPINKISYAYNYGIFDFDQPNFYLNFTKGRPVYKLGVWSYGGMKSHYSNENRNIAEQTLNLTLEEKQKVFDFLEENKKPENRDYVYNYVYDNCATKMRDVINIVLGDQITYNNDYVDQKLSLRDLMDLYLSEQPWGDLGIDICLGIQIDKEATADEYMFLPDYVELSFAKATIQRNGEFVPLVKSTERPYIAKAEPNVSSSITPMMVTVFLFFIIGLLTHRGLKYDLKYRGLDYTILAITGITGVLLLTLWLGTDHLSKYNWNLFWAMPFNLLMIYFLRSPKSFSKFYFLFMGFVLILLIVFHGLLPQTLHLALIPIMLGMALRFFYLYFDLRRIENGERYIINK